MGCKLVTKKVIHCHIYRKSSNLYNDRQQWTDNNRIINADEWDDFKITLEKIHFKKYFGESTELHQGIVLVHQHTSGLICN